MTDPIVAPLYTGAARMLRSAHMRPGSEGHGRRAAVLAALQPRLCLVFGYPVPGNAGVDLELRIEGERRTLTPGLELSAFRIVQEALTNVLTNAEGARALVALRFQPAELEIEVRDEGGSARPPGPGGTQTIPKPVVRRFVTGSGLELFVPAIKGQDRCYRISLCTPAPDARLRLRGSELEAGFTRRP